MPLRVGKHPCWIVNESTGDLVKVDSVVSVAEKLQVSRATIYAALKRSNGTCKNGVERRYCCKGWFVYDNEAKALMKSMDISEKYEYVVYEQPPINSDKELLEAVRRLAAMADMLNIVLNHKDKVAAIKTSILSVAHQIEAYQPT